MVAFDWSEETLRFRNEENEVVAVKFNRPKRHGPDMFRLCAAIAIA